MNNQRWLATVQKLIQSGAQLIDDSDYQKSRSVYDEQKPSETKTKSQSTKGALPKGWKPE